MTGDDTKHLPLEDLHTAAGARFGAFAGWSMPLTYPAGVMKEHLHAREHAGLFDISHMKLFEVSGPGSVSLLDRAEAFAYLKLYELGLCTLVETGPGDSILKFTINDAGRQVLTEGEGS